MARDFHDWQLYHAQLGQARDAKALVTTVQRQTDQQVREWAKNSHAIVLSQERSAEIVQNGLQDVKGEIGFLAAGMELGLDRLSQGMAGLGALMHTGFGEIATRLESQDQHLQQVVDALWNPLGTQANELRRRAEKFLRDGLHDDALVDFLEAEAKNRADFVVLRNIANIYFYGTPETPCDLAKAIDYFRKAAKYSRADFPTFASECLLFEGICHAEKGDLQTAYKGTSEGLAISREVPELLYRHAIHACKVGKVKEGVEALREAITRHDPRYALKAGGEPELKPYEAPILKMIDGLRQEYGTKAVAYLKEMGSALTEVSAWPPSQEEAAFLSLKNDTSLLVAMVKRASFIDLSELLGRLTNGVHAKSRDLVTWAERTIEEDRENRRRRLFQKVQEQKGKVHEGHKQEVAEIPKVGDPFVDVRNHPPRLVGDDPWYVFDGGVIGVLDIAASRALFRR